MVWSTLVYMMQEMGRDVCSAKPGNADVCNLTEKSISESACLILFVWNEAVY